jgi:predicted small metal-binding protein
MARKYVDCRDYPDAKCTVAISADTDEELMAAAIHHGVAVHGMKDSPELRMEIRKGFKDARHAA